jgi:hypothetical protein
MTHWLPLGLAGATALGLLGSVASAQALRDPTQPPPIVAATGLNEAGQPAAIQPGSVAVIVRHGVPHLVVGTRLYAQGQKVGSARIERLTETEVWLREAGVLRKVQVFGGIQRQPSTASDSVHHSGQTTRVVPVPKP